MFSSCLLLPLPCVVLLPSAQSTDSQTFTPNNGIYYAIISFVAAGQRTLADAAVRRTATEARTFRSTVLWNFIPEPGLQQKCFRDVFLRLWPSLIFSFQGCAMANNVILHGGNMRLDRCGLLQSAESCHRDAYKCFLWAYWLCINKQYGDLLFKSFFNTWITVR